MGLRGERGAAQIKIAVAVQRGVNDDGDQGNGRILHAAQNTPVGREPHSGGSVGRVIGPCRYSSVRICPFCIRRFQNPFIGSVSLTPTVPIATTGNPRGMRLESYRKRGQPRGLAARCLLAHRKLPLLRWGYCVQIYRWPSGFLAPPSGKSADFRNARV